MTDLPFGFNGPSDPDDGDDDKDRRRREQGGSQDPFGFFTGAGGDAAGFDPAQLGQMLSQFGQMLSGMGGSMASGKQSGAVDYQLAARTAHTTIAGNPVLTEEQTQAVTESVRLAELWLDGATALPTGVTVTEVWTAGQWVDATIETWKRLCDPVAERMGSMWVEAMPEEMRQFAGPMMGMLTSMSGAAYGTQLGQALGQLAREVLTSTDIGLPLGTVGTAALLPTAIAEFSGGLELPRAEVMLFFAAREAAHHRLFHHVPWLASGLFDAVETYARGISIDLSAIEEAARGLDPSALTDPSALQDLLGGGVFQPQETPAQRQALERLELLLALVEGWVETVVRTALGERIPSTEALVETLRRRRAGGGPAEQTFATLVGLELRPRRLREAAALWSQVTEAVGAERRDQVWDHPDLLPGAEDLDNPAGFVDRLLDDGAGDLDDPIASIEKLMREQGGGAPDEDSGGGSGGDTPDQP